MKPTSAELVDYCFGVNLFGLPDPLSGSSCQCWIIARPNGIVWADINVEGVLVRIIMRVGEKLPSSGSTGYLRMVGKSSQSIPHQASVCDADV